MNEYGFAPTAKRAEKILEALNTVESTEKGTDMERMVAAHIKQYPVMSDALRARQLGISKNTVRSWRWKMGIKPLLEKRCVQCGEVKRATHTCFTVIDYGDGYRDVCNSCLNEPGKQHKEFNSLMLGWGR